MDVCKDGYRCDSPKAVATPCASMVSIMATTYPLNDSRTKYVTIGLNVNQSFKPYIMLGKSGSNHGIILTVDEWLLLSKKLHKFLSYVVENTNTENKTAEHCYLDERVGSHTIIYQYFCDTRVILIRGKDNSFIVLGLASIDMLLRLASLITHNVTYRGQWSTVITKWYDHHLSYLQTYLKHRAKDLDISVKDYFANVSFDPPPSTHIDQKLFLQEFAIFAVPHVCLKLSLVLNDESDLGKV